MLKLSYSKLDTYKQCPQKYKFQYIDGLKAPMGKALIYGIFVHKLLEDIEVKIKSSNGEIESLPEIVKPIWMKVKNSNLSRGLDESDLSRAKQAVQKYIYRLEKEDLPTILGVEEWFNIQIDDFKIVGKIDLITDDNGFIHVIDHKTTKLGSIKYLDDDRTQLQIYALAMSDKYGKPVDEIKASYSLINQDFEKKTYLFNKSDIDGVQNFIVNAGNSIKNDNTWEAKTGILCAWCSFYDSCNAPKDSRIKSKRKQVIAEEGGENN